MDISTPASALPEYTPQSERLGRCVMDEFYSDAASLYCALDLEAIRSWPVKGGSLRGFDPNTPFKSVDVTKRLIPRDVPLSRFDETAQDVRFARKWIVDVGSYPNGNIHRITVYGR